MPEFAKICQSCPMGLSPTVCPGRADACHQAKLAGIAEERARLGPALEEAYGLLERFMRLEVPVVNNTLQFREGERALVFDVSSFLARRKKSEGRPW